MGQKVRPTGFRTGIFIDWQSHWYANKQDFAELLVEDQKIRKYLKTRYREKGAGIAKIRIQRTREKVTVFIHSARVGVIIGPPSIRDSSMMSSSMPRAPRSSALPSALFSTCSMRRALRLGRKRSMCNASSATLPRISAATGRSFRAVTSACR